MFFGLFKKRNNTQTNPIEASKYLKDAVLDTIELSVSTEKGIKHYQSNVAKFNGNNTVLVIIVGMNGSIYSYENKLLEIATKVKSVYGSTVFIFSNDKWNWYNSKNFFNNIMKYVKESMKYTNDVKIKLFGTSAGASFISYYAWRYPEITDLLLVNPPLMSYLEVTINNMKKYKGDSTLVMGRDDIYCRIGEVFTHEQYKGLFGKVVIIDGADHFFTGLLDEFANLPLEYLYDRIVIYA